MPTDPDLVPIGFHSVRIPCDPVPIQSDLGPIRSYPIRFRVVLSDSVPFRPIGPDSVDWVRFRADSAPFRSHSVFTLSAQIPPYSSCPLHPSLSIPASPPLHSEFPSLLAFLVSPPTLSCLSLPLPVLPFSCLGSLP